MSCKNLINNVLEDKNLHININPVDVYKQWINSMEYNSGQMAGMPYDVTAEQALKYEEVQKRLQKSITSSGLHHGDLKSHSPLERGPGH